MSRLPAVLATTLLAFGLSSSAAQGAAVSVSGKLPRAKGFSVLAVSPDGSAVRAPVGARGAFKLRLKRAKGATLQLVRPSGGYFGPVVLADAKRKGKVHLALSGKAVALGTLTLRRSWAEAGPKVPARRTRAACSPLPSTSARACAPAGSSPPARR